jgi:hypothetical protein
MTKHTILDRIQLAQREYNDLFGYVGGLSQQDLAEQSSCEQWRMCEVVAYLAFVAKSFRER